MRTLIPPFFKNPFFKVIFDGNKRMVDDTTYNNAFARSVIKKQIKEESKTTKVTDTTKVLAVSKVPEVQAIIAGKVFLNGNPQLTVKNKPISIFNTNGDLVKSTYTNRFGAFAFSGMTASDVSKIKMDINDISGDNSLNLVTSKTSVLPVLNRLAALANGPRNPKLFQN